ncbi:MAG TPA: peptidyl-prolyl cis-trans isomerase [Thermodesulfobacteriota bacterium]|nr:peptidyl-prolyl cis-trans isomerase [Thermodesulfobacteriota bacterium]
MRHIFFKLVLILTLLLFSGTTATGAEEKLPVIEGKEAVATVNGEPITLEELNRDLPLASGASKSEVLRRLINVSLVVQEGKRIGLDELPEIKNMVDAFSKVTLREELMERQIKDIRVDDKEVEKLYKESIKEWKISSLLFEKEDAAKKMAEEIKAGKNFDELSKRYVAEGKAKEGERGVWLKVKDISPQIVNTVSKMKAGSVSPIIPFKSGFVILRLEDIRYTEAPEAMEQAREEAIKRKKVRVLKDYSNGLIKKYAKVNQDVLKGIDYESKTPGFEALLQDKRAVAEIRGESPITVGELTQHLKMQFFHGIERAIESKKLNSKKVPALDEIIYKRVFRKEALRLGLDKTEGYENKVKEYERSVLFGAFVNKVIVPDIKLKEEEMKAYYSEHIKEYTMPEMMKINGLVFAKREDGEAAVEKLRKGTEFQWLAENAEGQVDKDTKGLLTFDGKLVTTKDLPEGVQKAIHGARAGDFRLYESPDGYFYALAIQDVIPSKPQPFEEAREEVAKRLFDEKVKKAVEDYADKLRAVSEMKIYLKDS